MSWYFKIIICLYTLLTPINITDCSENCLTCYGGNDNQCLSCPNGKVLESGSCLSNCSIGNYLDQNNFCQGSSIFEFLFLFYFYFFKKNEKIRMSITLFNMYRIRQWRMFKLCFTISSKWDILYFRK